MDKPKDRDHSPHNKNPRVHYAQYPTSRYVFSRYAQDAVKLLGGMIHNARVKKRMTVDEVAERAGVSRGRVHRMEKGHMGCSIGAVFEVAALVGVPLFDAERTALTRHLTTVQQERTLLPNRARVRVSTKAAKDDF